jgi:hypothetical protein
MLKWKVYKLLEKDIFIIIICSTGKTKGCVEYYHLFVCWNFVERIYVKNKCKCEAEVRVSTGNRTVYREEGSPVTNISATYRLL